MLLDTTTNPFNLALDLIDEDPNQPRSADNPGFSEQSIAEIGQTIKDRGVKSPISVRENPEQPGRYLINHGARRYRGSKWAGKSTIPAFVDNDYNEIDQVVENLQRNELTAREIANFIGRELAKGKKKGVIARELGKSPAYITQYAALLDLPDPVADAFNSGRLRDVTVVNEILTAWKRAPDRVARWLSEQQELTRGSVSWLREYLDGAKSQQVQSDGGVARLGQTKASGGRPAEMQGGHQVNVYLDEISLATAKEIGNGNVSSGIREALRRVRIAVMGE